MLKKKGFLKFQVSNDTPLRSRVKVENSYIVLISCSRRTLLLLCVHTWSSRISNQQNEMDDLIIPNYRNVSSCRMYACIFLPNNNKSPFWQNKWCVMRCLYFLVEVVHKTWSVFKVLLYIYKYIYSGDLSIPKLILALYIHIKKSKEKRKSERKSNCTYYYYHDETNRAHRCICHCTI